MAKSKGVVAAAGSVAPGGAAPVKEEPPPRKSDRVPAVRRHLPELDEVAGRLVDGEFGEAGLPCGVRFSELEEISVELGHAVARRIMSLAAARQAAALSCGDADGKPHGCPACGREGVSEEDEPRILITRAGDAEWSEPKYKCRSCRRSFFPSVG